jgi:hypothetical protein
MKQSSAIGIKTAANMRFKLRSLIRNVLGVRTFESPQTSFFSSAL